MPVFFQGDSPVPPKKELGLLPNMNSNREPESQNLGIISSPIEPLFSNQTNEEPQVWLWSIEKTRRIEKLNSKKNFEALKSLNNKNSEAKHDDASYFSGEPIWPDVLKL